MPWEPWFTLAVVVLLILALASNRVGADTAMLGALTLIMLAGIIEPVRALSGFGDPSVLMIGAMFVVATGLSQTGAMESIAQKVLGRPRNFRSAQLRLMVPVAAMSAFMNNTPIVAMYLPIVSDWARKLRISPSKLFMPLSFAAILGGACTLIGTSTNLAVNALYMSYFREHGEALAAAFAIHEPSTVEQFWRIAIVGAPCAVLGIGFVVLTSRWLLPERIAPIDTDAAERQYTVAVHVEPNSPVVGKTIEQAGLRSLPGLFLTEIERDGEIHPAVGPEEVLRARDVLVFVGVVESVVDLLKTKGLAPATDQVNKVAAKRGERTVVEAVVSHTSPLVRKTVKQSQFRTRYNAAIIAVHRNGQRVRGKIGDIVLQPGDTLLLSTHRGFTPAYRNSGDFYLVSNVEGAKVVRHERAWLSIAILALLVALLTIPFPWITSLLNAATGWALPPRQMPPVVVGFFCAILMVYTRCCTGSQARASVNWQVLIVIASALGIGKAMTDSGAAQLVADAIFGSLAFLGPRGLLFTFAILTAVFCQLITNKGAAVLMFPIGMAIADDLAVNPEPFVITLMVAAACSFMTPVGFVTNLMVYGPGGYRFTDYLRLGIPLTLLVAAIATLIAPLAWPFNP